MLWRRLLAEFLGSAFLAAVVIGSGIAAQNLSPGNVGLELFENAAATATGLFAIILMFGPISGGHFNPVVSFVDAAFGGLKWKDAAAYLPFQVLGCISGAIVANIMFSEAAISISTKHRATGPHWLSEVVATIGLILVIFALGTIRTVPPRPGRRRRLHRGRLLLHQLDQLCQPGHHRRAHVLQHLRRHCAFFGPEFHLGPDRRRRRGLRVDQGAVPGHDQGRGGRRHRAAPAGRDRPRDPLNPNSSTPSSGKESHAPRCHRRQ